jgi:hypothetical protein
MKKLIAVLAALLMALAVPAPAMAKTVTTPFTGIDAVAGAPIDEGRTWMTGDGVQHVRGMVVPYNATSDNSEYYRGTTTLVINWNLDTATMRGTMWGTSHLALTEKDGGFVGTWTAKFAGPDAPWTGRGVAKGYGDAGGLFQRYQIVSTGQWTDQVTGTIINPGARH